MMIKLYIYIYDAHGEFLILNITEVIDDLRVFAELF